MTVKNRYREHKQQSTVYPTKRACELLGGYSIPRLNAAIEQFALWLSRVPDRWHELTDTHKDQLTDLLEALRFDWTVPEATGLLPLRARMMGFERLAVVIDGWSADERTAVVFKHKERL